MSLLSYPRITFAVLALSAFFFAGGGSAQAAQNSLGVPVSGDTTATQYSGTGGPATLAGGTALYVDATGAAHVAYIDPDGSDIDLCTIPGGGSTCIPAGTLHTDGTTFQEPVDSIKYLPDGNGSAILVVGLTLLGSDSQPHPPFDPNSDAPYSETEVFLPGSTTGIGIGDTYDQGGSTGGDEIYVQSAGGIDVVGIDSAIVPHGAYPANAFQFESFTSPSSSDSAASFLGVEGLAFGPGYLPASEELPGEWPVGVTQLANGETAVLAENVSAATLNGPDHGYLTLPFASAVGMYVQPAAGGAFAPVRQLGVSGPIETDFAASEDTYLVNVESGRSCNASDDCSGGIVNEPMELYDFRGSTLKPLGTIGATQGDYGQQSAWDTLPPSFEDSAGDMYVAWTASNGEDGCPATPPDSDNLNNVVDGCVVYRRIAPGGLFGPKIVLSYSYSDQGIPDKYDIGDVDQIATNAAGEGWVLAYRGTGAPGSRDLELYAQPLVSSGGLSAAPTVSGSSVSVPLTCSGALGGSCRLSATLDRSASMANAAAASKSKGSHKPKHSDAVLASAHFKLTGGGARTLVLHLNRTGKRLLARKHHLAVTLQVSQTVGLTAKPTPILTSRLTLR